MVLTLYVLKNNKVFQVVIGRSLALLKKWPQDNNNSRLLINRLRFLQMKRLIKILAKLIIAFLGLWCVGASIAALYGVALYFPFYISEGNEIPYHRMQSTRITILLSFAFYSLKYLVSESKQLYPIQFLDTILKIYVLSSLVLFIRYDVIRSEYIVLFFLLLMAIVSHIVSRPKLRRYYYSKFSD